MVALNGPWGDRCAAQLIHINIYFVHDNDDDTVRIYTDVTRSTNDVTLIIYYNHSVNVYIRITSGVHCHKFL